MQLGRYFTLSEMTFSQTAVRNGIRNTPLPVHVEALQQLVLRILDPLRASLNRPVQITSGYRSPQLNVAIGGSLSSQHSRGEAADIVVPNMAPIDVCRHIIEMKLPFDQLILEFDRWVHVSYRRAGDQRGEVLTAARVDGKVMYLKGLQSAGVR